MYDIAHNALQFLPGYVRKRTERLATLKDSHRYDARGHALGAVRGDARLK